ncbi:hypothetical protein [Candidatus Venteria ishoeyi]|uniref:Uncharacterized protein n=1 Tax=Candidatus Venteria ishoeyi TaxID=1899563 RepID=A0A1H6F459_9GAMM|nr:hypothetical protein [Candidatus Venteria ishoeyi]MDM8548033.1 hypothetical protein [Candidatus Venteria ishoeyi]SEH04947.1 Uncharacterised protein [Candidatus Venteria ishoeyi]
MNDPLIEPQTETHNTHKALSAPKLYWIWGMLFMLLLGLSIFIGSAWMILNYQQQAHQDTQSYKAYDHHVMLQAQLAMARLEYRLQLANLDPETVAEDKTRASLPQQVEITWSRFNDLISGQNAQRLLKIKGLKTFIRKILTELDLLESSLHDSEPDYEQHLLYLDQLKKEFAADYTNLPAQLLPIYKDENKALREVQSYYFKALILTSLLVFVLYGIVLFGIFNILKTRSQYTHERIEE